VQANWANDQIILGELSVAVLAPQIVLVPRARAWMCRPRVFTERSMKESRIRQLNGVLPDLAHSLGDLIHIRPRPQQHILS